MLPSAGAAPAAGRAKAVACPGGRGTEYAAPESGADICTNCSLERTKHKLPTVVAPVSKMLEQIMKFQEDPVSKTSPPPPPPPSPPHFKLPFEGWFQSLDSAGNNLYFNSVRSQREKPELPLPLGWNAVMDPKSCKIFYAHYESRTSQWNPPLPLHWKEGTSLDGGLCYVRKFADSTETVQSEPPLTFMFCPSGHSLRSYCDR